jgi:hypothetical protein
MTRLTLFYSFVLRFSLHSNASESGHGKFCDKRDREVQRKNILERVGRACNANIPLIDVAIVSQACREKLGRLLLELCFVSSQVEVRMLVGVCSSQWCISLANAATM